MAIGKSTLLALLFTGLLQPLAAQLGGLSTYSFLKMPVSARITGLGGNLIAVVDDDVNLAAQNPALLNPAMHQQLGFNHGFLIDGIQYGYVAYGHHVPGWKTTLHGGLQYVQYGVFDYTDELGNENGSFKAAEYAFTLGAGRQVNERLSVGLNARLITSQLESYHSLGLAADLAGVYRDTSSRFTLAVVARNIGAQLRAYRPGNTEALPYDFQIGISKRLKHVPFRFSAAYHHLHQWNLLYDNPNAVQDTPLFNDTPPKPPSKTSELLDNFFRHIIIGGELLIGQQENLRIRLGYNHLLRQDMSVASYRSVSGFSLGAGIKISRFRLDYGRSQYHLAGGMNHLGISTNFREFRRG